MLRAGTSAPPIAAAFPSLRLAFMRLPATGYDAGTTSSRSLAFRWSRRCTTTSSYLAERSQAFPFGRNENATSSSWSEEIHLDRTIPAW